MRKEFNELLFQLVLCSSLIMQIKNEIFVCRFFRALMGVSAAAANKIFTTKIN